MTQDEPIPFTREALEDMNQKAVENQFFTPDHVYLDLSLLKDFTAGAVFADAFTQGKERFTTVQQQFLTVVKDYQIRTYDTSNPFLAPLGYPDEKIEAILADPSLHSQIFLLSPSTNFLSYLIRHTIRNQNHSSPVGKFTKKKVSKDRYALEPIAVTFYINTHPLSLPVSLLTSVAKEFGESFGVNVQFLNKDPHLFDEGDWSQWMEKIECFYLNSLGRFTGGDMVYAKQGNMEFVGTYRFARKRFEKWVMAQMQGYDFAKQIATLTAHSDMLCDFEWIPNGDLLLLPDPTVLSEAPSSQTE